LNLHQHGLARQLRSDRIFGFSPSKKKIPLQFALSAESPGTTSVLQVFALSRAGPEKQPQQLSRRGTYTTATLHFHTWGLEHGLLLGFSGLTALTFALVLCQMASKFSCWAPGFGEYGGLLPLKKTPKTTALNGITGAEV